MDELDARQREILRAIVQEHIATGEPVGSSAIARREIPVSSATVRSVMADLEELGYLGKPHTSAGRIPTDRGYRYYVDGLVQIRPPTKPERALLDKSLAPPGPADEVLRETSKTLSALSHYAAVVTTPGFGSVPLHRVEFVRLKDDRVLAVLMSVSGLVRNRLLTLDAPMSLDELAHAAAWFNDLLEDGPLEQVRERIQGELEHDRSELDALRGKALALGLRLIEATTASGHELLVEGQEKFFESPEFADIKRMRELFHALEERSRLLSVLDRTLGASDVQIFIGAETEFSARTGASVVAARYATESGVVGSIGVIGPTRMNYSRVIPLVDYTAQVLSKLLERG